MPIGRETILFHLAGFKRQTPTQPKRMQLASITQPPDPFDWRTIPNDIVRQKHRKTRAIPGGRVPRVDCCIFKYADLLYQGFSQAERDLWRAAAKKPHMSPYDLWMHEAIPYLQVGMSPPDSPSIHGGYSTDLLSPGSREPALDCYYIDLIKSAQLEFDHVAQFWNYYRATIEFFDDKFVPPYTWTAWLAAWGDPSSTPQQITLVPPIPEWQTIIRKDKALNQRFYLYVHNSDVIYQEAWFSPNEPWSFHYPTRFWQGY